MARFINDDNHKKGYDIVFNFLKGENGRKYCPFDEINNYRNVEETGFYDANDRDYSNFHNFIDKAVITPVNTVIGDDKLDSCLYNVMLVPLCIPLIERKAEKSTLMDELCQKYKINKYARRDLEGFIEFHNNLQKYDFDDEKNVPYYNLIINTEDQDFGMKFAEELCEILKCDLVKYTESEVIDNPSFAVTEGDMVVITDLQEAPKIDHDTGSGLSLAFSKDRVQEYKDAWKCIVNTAKENPAVPFIVICNNNILNGSLKNNTEVYYRVFGRRVKLVLPTWQELFHDCLSTLKKGDFDFEKNFESDLENYFKSVYPIAELKQKEFVDDLVIRINQRLVAGNFKKYNSECIPKFRPLSTGDDILRKIDSMVGLNSVKRELHKIHDAQVTSSALGGGQMRVNHMCFLGNPGTGKTTVARMVSELLFSMKVLSNTKFVEIKPSELVSQFVGNSSLKARSELNRARGGIAFIDEAYAFDTSDQHFKDVWDNVIIPEMEDSLTIRSKEDRILFILAGYNDQMERMLKRNPGSASRLQKIYFEDYSVEELKVILNQILESKNYTLADDDRTKRDVETLIMGRRAEPDFGNGREMRKLSDEMQYAWMQDYLALKTKAEKEGREAPIPVMQISYRNLKRIISKPDEDKLDNLVGLDLLKGKLSEFENMADFVWNVRKSGKVSIPPINLHMLFMGNPGTGKTRVAKYLAGSLYRKGILKTDKITVVERKDLAKLDGQDGPAQVTAEVIRRAKGGILFIDEAYSIAEDKAIIEVLLTAMENNKEDTIFIFAGYPAEMDNFLDSNPGIRSRIGYTFEFPDYKPEELVKIFELKMKDSGFKLSKGVNKNILKIMEYFHAVPNFGNGRFVDHVISRTFAKRALRGYDEKNGNSILAKDIPTIAEIIETKPDLGFVDPDKITIEEKLRTAVHELGHAVIGCEMAPGWKPEIISIRAESGSAGRVRLNREINRNAEAMLVMAFGGRNAERLFFGKNGMGVSGDFQMAKRIAHDMIHVFAMGTIGRTTETDLLVWADKTATQILTRYKEFIIEMRETLLEKEVLDGKTFVNEFSKFKMKLLEEEKKQEDSKENESREETNNG